MKTYKIKTNGRNKEILAKAKELGYKASPILGLSNPEYFYFKKNADIWHGINDQAFETDKSPEISVEDFLKLGEKPDAYMTAIRHGSYPGYIYYVCGTCRHEGKNRSLEIEARHLHQYNLLSEEEYRAKYPDKLQLKGHDVEFISDNFVKIGTVTFHSYMLRLLFRNIKDHGNDPCEFSDVTLEDLFHFISENKEKFGL